MSNDNTEFSDIQGLVRFGHGQLKDACFLLLNIVDVNQARMWLSAAPVTSAEFTDKLPQSALQIAFSAEGLRELQLDESVIESFSSEFIVGMSADESRSRRLGDIAENDPQNWQWGGSSESTTHLLLMLYSKNGMLESWRKQLQDSVFEQAFHIISDLPTNDIGHIEPFGFVDGISQPAIDWETKQSTDIHARDRFSNLLALGEILLGYNNEYGEYTTRPLIDSKDDSNASVLPIAADHPELHDLGRNGSYLVMRQLQQEVTAFWKFIDQEAVGDEDQREQLASAMVGRQRDGTPLIDTGKRLIQGINEKGIKTSLNQFDYDDDPDGQKCPIGSHIRRSNPRNGDFPPGVSGLVSRLIRILGFGRKYPGEDLIASTRFHRLLRRGRSYGPKLSPEEAIKSDTPQLEKSEQEERGLHFICLVANISRQFEFVQNSWLMGSKFGGVQNETDPLLGNRQPLLNGENTNHFSQPDAQGPARCTHDLPQFVTVQGGGYFFMPGILALRYIATAPVKSRNKPTNKSKEA